MGLIVYSANDSAMIAMDEVLSRITETQAYKNAGTGPQNCFQLCRLSASLGFPSFAANASLK